MEIDIHGYKVLIDEEDYNRVKSFTWSVKPKEEGAYFFNRSNNETVYLHKIILGVKNKRIVDHRDGNRLNNTKDNLRICTKSENTRNQKRKSDSHLKGVTWHKDCNKWGAQIMVDYKNIFLGLYNSEEEAHKAYCEASKKYHGEFGRIA